MAQETASYVGPVTLENTLYFLFVTKNGSDVPTDADSTPTGVVYDAVSAAAMGVTVTITKISGQDGLYSVAVAVTAANGFDADEGHSIRVSYAISSSARTQVFRFTVT